MFRPLSLWQQVPCPALEARGSCTITHCLFSHNLPPPASLISVPPALPAPTTSSTDPRIQKNLGSSVRNFVTTRDTTPTPSSGDPRLRKIIQTGFGNSSNSEEKRESKRRRLSDDEDSISSSSSKSGGISLVDTPAPAVKRTKTKVETAGSAAVGPKSILKKSLAVTQKAPTPTPKTTAASRIAVSEKNSKKSLPLSTPVTKPATLGVHPRPVQNTAVAPAKPGKAEGAGETEKPLALNPRLVPVSPASHAIRLQLLTLLHKEYVRLHEGKGDPQEMLRLALDEEEKVAREMKSIYTQAMKKRIVKFKNTAVVDYQKEQEEKKKQTAREEEERKRTMTIHGVAVDNGMDNSKPPLITGLSPVEELNALGTIIQSLEELGKYRYILEPPTVEEVEVAAKGMKAAGGWEACDRCSSRFQVFDGRRESDGQLAGGGNCTYHWGRAAWPPRSSSTYAPRDNDKVFTCCRQRVGQSTGCVTCENHVYKVSEAKRLAAIWQFVKTPCPQNPQDLSPGEKKPKKKSIERAICLDCEMCYTTQGMELIRITATAFPSGEVIVDALVRPQGGILDLNSRYSGVFPKHLMEATPHQTGPYPPMPMSSDSFINPTLVVIPSNDTNEETLPILSSPEAARSLLLSYINSETPILGHALENDLNALRLCHQTIIDTAILFPHKNGFPLRNKLKWLVEKHLERKIQVDGDTPQGHDSKIDARCAGELVRWMIAEMESKKKRYQVRPKVPKKDQDQRMDLDKPGESGEVVLEY